MVCEHESQNNLMNSKLNKGLTQTGRFAVPAMEPGRAFMLAVATTPAVDAHLAVVEQIARRVAIFAACV